MSEKNYHVSKKTLTELSNHITAMFNVGTFLQEEYNKEVNGDFRKEVISDGVHYRLDKHYNDIYRLLNVICNDGKITSEV